MKVIDSFNYAMKNVVDNSFYLLNSKEIKSPMRNSDILMDKLIDKDKEYNVKMLIPMNLMDFENMLDKNQSSNNVYMVKFHGKLVLHLFVNSNIQWGEVVSVLS